MNDFYDRCEEKLQIAIFLTSIILQTRFQGFVSSTKQRNVQDLGAAFQWIFRNKVYVISYILGVFFFTMCALPLLSKIC